MVVPKRMEIYYANLIKTDGSVQHGRRPVLVISNNIANQFSQTVIIAPFTSQQNDLPTHVAVDLTEVKGSMSVLKCEQITTISINQLGAKIGKIEDPNVIRRINRALAIAIGLDDHFNRDLSIGYQQVF